MELPLVVEEEIQPENGIPKKVHIPVKVNRRRRRENIPEDLEAKILHER